MRRKSKRLFIGIGLAVAGCLFFLFGHQASKSSTVPTPSFSNAAGAGGDGRGSRQVSGEAKTVRVGAVAVPTEAKKTSTSQAANVDQLDRIVMPGANPYQMHGRIGLKGDGSPGFVLKEAPPADQAMQQLMGHGFNARLSDSISLNRNVSDHRDKACHNVHYDVAKLPRATVVFVFHNEYLSILLRSIHSVLNRSPPALLKEIVLVDDGSTFDWIKEPLEQYIKLLPKVKLVRQPKRSGLVKARIRGFEEATADVVIVLDSHIEVQPGWLEPMLQRIYEEPHAVVMPQIDSLVPETLDPQAGGIGCSLGFLWSLVEHGIANQEAFQRLRKSEADPVPTPTHAGGLFGLRRDYFFELGGYDPDWGFWGAENLEFSFRIWQCGGRLECTPCSRVYHAFRKGGPPYTSPGHHLAMNKLRTARLWMDEYAFIAEEAMGRMSVDPGPLDNMKALRERLKCKSFDWFLKNVYPEALFTDLNDLLGMGLVESVGKEGMCLSGMGYPGGQLTLTPCSQNNRQQHLMVLKSLEVLPVSNMEMCLVNTLKFDWCQRWRRDTRFIFTEDHQLRHDQSSMCLTAGPDNVLSMAACRPEATQRWNLGRHLIPQDAIAMHNMRDPGE